MNNGLLRQRRPGRPARVTFVELFFDLVFVIAVAQISHLLLEHLTWGGALRAAMLLVTIWWAWIDTAWITNWLDPQKPAVRLMLFALMGIGLVITSALPDAFGERGLVFAVAFVLFQLGRTAFMLWAVRADATLFRNFVRIVIWYGVSSILWLLGGFAEGDLRLWIWLVAVILDTISAMVNFWVPGLGRADTREWTIDGGLMAERTGLFIIIALGESILSTGRTFMELEWTSSVATAMAVSLLQSVAMWWIYFGQHAGAAAAAIAKSDDPGRVARFAYTYVPILLTAGIVLAAVGDELVLSHPDGHVEPDMALVIVGGPALFLAGAVLFKLGVFKYWSIPRLTGLAVILGIYPLAGSLSPLLLSAATTGVMVALAAWEVVDIANHPERFGDLSGLDD